MLRRSARLARWALPMLGLMVAGTLGTLLWQRATFIDPRPSAILTDRHGAFMAQLGGDADGYGYWPVDAIPDRVAAAILALEDRRFWQHPGVDPLAVLRALRANLSSERRISGASTLAMQLARMQHPAARGYLVKAVEAATALVMTARYGRLGVFKQYLRLVPFGQSSHGIAHAARWYFDKPVTDLSWAEIAFLSAIPQSPSSNSPGTGTGRARAVDRGRKALLRLHDEGVITDTELAQALVDIDGLAPRPRPTRDPDALHAILRIAELARSGEPQERIRSTIDLGLQARVALLARQRLDQLRPQGAQQVAVMVVDRERMGVLALVGSGRYAAADAGKIDYALRARSPGSTLKPFIFAQAIDTGTISPATILLDAPDSGTGIDNADRRFLGPLLPRQALGNSRNVPAALLVRRSGLDRSFWFLANLGLPNTGEEAARYGLTLSVGGMPTALDRLVTAYGAIANDGTLAPLRWYEDEPIPPARRVISPETARLVTAFLADPMARLPSFARMGATEYPFPVAVKTGTSQGYRDAWVAAFSERYLLGVWVGRPDGQPMGGLGGAASAALIGHDILMELHGQDWDGLADGSFRSPQGLDPVALCTATGRPSDGHCGPELTEYLPPAAFSTTTVAAKPAARRWRIVAPINGSVFIRNPEQPPGLAFLPLRLSADGAAEPVIWYVDGRAYQTADSKETVRWRVEPGRHSFEARLSQGGGVGSPVEVTIR